MNGGRRVDLIGLGFDPVTMAQVIETCVGWCREPRQSHTVVTANASHLCAMRRDPELARACSVGDLVVADGMSVVWASRWAGDGFPERVAGVDLMTLLLEVASRLHLRVYFLGARPEVVTDVVEACRTRCPDAVVAGSRDGYFTSAEHDGIVEAIRAARPDMLFIGMPTPFKETWAERHRARLDVPVIMGVGGSFDVLAGHIQRAPRWVQSMGMEWSWRLLMEPRKLWRRYLTTNSEFLWLAARHAIRRRMRRSATPQERP